MVLLPYKETLKKNIQDKVANSDSSIFTDDLKTFLYLAKTDEDLSLLQQSIRKYESQALNALKYNFESPLMRLMYAQNKTDEALKIFMSGVKK